MSASQSHKTNYRSRSIRAVATVAAGAATMFKWLRYCLEQGRFKYGPLTQGRLRQGWWRQGGSRPGWSRQGRSRQGRLTQGRLTQGRCDRSEAARMGRSRRSESRVDRNPERQRGGWSGAACWSGASHAIDAAGEFGSNAKREPRDVSGGRAARAALLLSCLVMLTLSGCAAIRPLEGVPARYLPDELRSDTREDTRMIDLSLLRQSAPEEYRIDSGDVLAVYVENVLGQREQPPINQPVDDARPPTLGYPLTVRDDGTLSLPLIEPVPVRGKTIPQIEQQLRHAYTVQRRLLRPGQDRILVTLHRPRQHRILVVRQETQSDILSGVSISQGDIGTAKKGTGHVVTLPAYRNDVLNALVESGGLPGLDAQNVIYVMRARRSAPQLHGAMSPNPGRSHQQGPYNTAPGTRANQSGQANQSARANQSGHTASGPRGPVLNNHRPSRVQPGQQPGSARSSASSQRSGTGQRPSQSTLSPTGFQSPAGIGRQRGSRQRGSRQSGYAGSIRGQSPDDRHIRGQSPGYSHPNSPPVVQPANYEVRTSPRQMSEHMAGLPMPGPQGPSANIQPSWTHQPQHSWEPPAAWSHVDEIAPAELWNNPNVTRIPLRLKPHEAVEFTESDVMLEDGDIVFIASRDDEVFYTGGLLGGGEFPLPRDRDLDILEAIAIAEASNNASGPDAGRSALNSDVTISPSQAVVIRQLPNDSQVPILIDLYRARTHAAERINIQPGDYIIVQYTRIETVAAFIERHILQSALFGFAASGL